MPQDNPPKLQYIEGADVPLQPLLSIFNIGEVALKRALVKALTIQKLGVEYDKFLYKKLEVDYVNLGAIQYLMEEGKIARRDLDDPELQASAKDLLLREQRTGLTQVEILVQRAGLTSAFQPRR